MNMATKLTKAFAAFVGEGGEIANEDEISQPPVENYKLARQEGKHALQHPRPAARK